MRFTAKTAVTAITLHTALRVLSAILTILTRVCGGVCVRGARALKKSARWEPEASTDMQLYRGEVKSGGARVHSPGVRVHTTLMKVTAHPCARGVEITTRIKNNTVRLGSGVLQETAVTKVIKTSESNIKQHRNQDGSDK